MRYSKHHKATTRQKILTSARQLFITQGFTTTTIEQIMSICNLTRGGFYAHFKSKSDLYHHAIGVEQPDDKRSVAGVSDLVDEYLADGDKLGVLINDMGLNEAEIKSTYTQYLKDLLQKWRRSNDEWDEDTLLSTAAMLIGASAIVKTTNEANLKAKLLQACKKRGAFPASLSPYGRDIFWDPSA